MKWVCYVILLIANQFFTSLLTGYSVNKHFIGKDLNFDEKFFGLCEFITMISMVIGMVYFILVPPSRLNLAYFICGIFQTSSAFLMMMAYYFPSHSKLIFIIAMIIFGCSRAAVACPYMLLMQFFNEPEDSIYVNIWFGLIELGIGWGFLIETWLLDSLMLHWTVALVILFLIFLFTITLVFVVVPETHREEGSSLANEIVKNKRIIQEHYSKQLSNSLLCFDFSMQENQQFSFLFWGQYYFMRLQFGFKATIISMSFPIATLLGSLTLNPFVSSYPRQVPIITSGLMLLCFLFSLLTLFLDQNIDNLVYYVIIFFVYFYLWIVPFSKTLTNELSEKVCNDEERYVVFNVTRLMREVYTAVTMLITGHLVEIKLHYFVYTFIGLAFINLLVHVGRRIAENREANRRDELAAVDDSE